jgi:hypothetical protein
MEDVTLMGDLVTVFVHSFTRQGVHSTHLVCQRKFIEMILSGERELQGTSPSNAYVRRILGADGLPGASVDVISSRYMNLVVNKLVAYKTLDAMQWVATGGNQKQSTQVVRPLRYFQGVPKLEQLVSTSLVP